MMLSETDASHIIRTIEYWDVERQRYPVSITERSSWPRKSPLDFSMSFDYSIAQSSSADHCNRVERFPAFQFGDEVVLQFIRVLDIYDEVSGEPEEEEGAELVDRGYWEKKSRPESLAVVESIKALTPTTKGEPKLTYNKHHIALRTSGSIFVGFIPER
jgi:hypothetical protein